MRFKRKVFAGGPISENNVLPVETSPIAVSGGLSIIAQVPSLSRVCFGVAQPQDEDTQHRERHNQFLHAQLPPGQIC